MDPSTSTREEASHTGPNPCSTWFRLRKVNRYRDTKDVLQSSFRRMVLPKSSIRPWNSLSSAISQSATCDCTMARKPSYDNGKFLTPSVSNSRRAYRSAMKAGRSNTYSIRSSAVSPPMPRNANSSLRSSASDRPATSRGTKSSQSGILNCMRFPEDACNSTNHEQNVLR